MLFRKPRSRIARAFYCDVLQGRQVWDTATVRRASLSFVVQGTRIDVGAHEAHEDGEAVVLSVQDPRAVAERCWDAGYSVRVGDDATGEPAVAVIDPFGRRIDLVR
jgi:catechol 2,3-dioxygenase-like lactoylglutathione lyase family enzyme